MIILIINNLGVYFTKMWKEVIKSYSKSIIGAFGYGSVCALGMYWLHPTCRWIEKQNNAEYAIGGGLFCDGLLITCTSLFGCYRGWRLGPKVLNRVWFQKQIKDSKTEYQTFKSAIYQNWKKRADREI